MDISVLMAKVFKSIKCGCYFQINSCIYGHAQWQNQFPNHISRVPCCFWRVHPLTNGSYGKWTLEHMQAKSCNTPSLFFKMDWYTPSADRFKQQLIGGYNGGLSWCCGSLRSSWLSWKLELHLEDDLPISISHVVGSISNFQGVIIYHGWMNVIYIHLQIHIYIYITYYYAYTYAEFSSASKPPTHHWITRVSRIASRRWQPLVAAKRSRHCRCDGDRGSSQWQETTSWHRFCFLGFSEDDFCCFLHGKSTGESIKA